MSGRHAAPKSGRHAAVPRYARHPSRLTFRVTAAAVVAAVVAGVAATVTAGQGSGSAAGDVAAINRAGSASVSGNAGSVGAPGKVGSASAPGNVRAVRRGLAVGRATTPTTPTTPTKPYLMYDSVEPSAIPLGHVIATYTTGPYAIPASAVAGRQVLWIDTNATDPSADALDIEPTDATPQQAADWAVQKLTANPHALAHLYCSQGEWPAVQAAVAATVPAKLRSRIRWWIADPTGYPHLVPGSDATQWYWGSTYDISTVTPHFGPIPSAVG